MFQVKKYFCFIVSFCFLTASLFLYAWAEAGSGEKASERQKTGSQQKQPRISFDSTLYDVGEVWEGDDVVHTFTVKNTGTAQLAISKVRTG